MSGSYCWWWRRARVRHRPLAGRLAGLAALFQGPSAVIHSQDLSSLKRLMAGTTDHPKLVSVGSDCRHRARLMITTSPILMTIKCPRDGTGCQSPLPVPPLAYPPVTVADTSDENYWWLTAAAIELQLLVLHSRLLKCNFCCHGFSNGAAGTAVILVLWLLTACSSRVADVAATASQELAGVCYDGKQLTEAEATAYALLPDLPTLHATLVHVS